MFESAIFYCHFIMEITVSTLGHDIRTTICIASLITQEIRKPILVEVGACGIVREQKQRKASTES